MRIVTLFCLVVSAVYVSSENCTVGGDCSVTMCGTSFHVICEHPNPSAGIVADGGLCTCAATDTYCSYRSECQTTTIQTALNCISMERLHCYDNNCICSRF